MTAENWEKLRRIVANASEMTTERKRIYVEEICRAEPELCPEIESLLAAEEQAEDFFSAPAAESYAVFFADEDEEDAAALKNQIIGNYRIERELGRGGTGAVYLAERADGSFEQQVAVKMLRRELNTKDFRRRFNDEKKILAKLQHPNIARLLDAGTTADGIPYLIMEYVDGVPIDAFCSESNLDLNERLKLFNIVCEAVAFAHRNLIIHRDIKPLNILVTADGAPKLLDFGISKLLAAPDTKGDETLSGALTPEYASPEQIKGETVSTATDVYSLGVVLYKMLTGTLPYHFQKNSDALIFQTITESEPILPSRAVTNKPDKNLKPIAPSRLAGDLDNIILKALAKDPVQRYETIEQFSADIRRFLDGLPVLAHPTTFSYRAKKFYRRNRVVVTAGIVVILSLFIGIVVSISQARRAENNALLAAVAKLQADGEADHARQQQERAEKISGFLRKVFSYANPAWYAEGAKFKDDARVIDVLDDLGGQIDTEFAGQPDVQAELHHQFTEVYNIVGKREKDSARAEKFREQQRFHAFRALELRKSFYGARHELVAMDLFYAQLLETDKRKQAAMLQEAIQMMRETNPNNLNLPYMLQDYASRLVLPNLKEFHESYRQEIMPPTAENNYQIAKRYLREAATVFRSHYKDDNYAMLRNECLLAYALGIQKKADFEEHFQSCLQSKNVAAQEINLLEAIKSLRPTK